MKNITAIILMSLILPNYAVAQQSINIGYFNEWPLPAHFGRQENTFDDALSAPLNWSSFGRASDMSNALENGTIDMALSQGIAPLLVALNNDNDIEIIDIAVAYTGVENCVVRARLNVSAENASDLEGLKVALPVGTSVHFSLLKQLTHLGVNASKLTLIDMSPARAAVAFSNGDVDMACGWGTALEQMKTRGNVLLDGEELVAIGVLSFDTILVKSFYGVSSAEQISKLLNINDKLNFAFDENPEPMIAEIAASVAMTPSAARETLSGFTFLQIEEKLSEQWMDGGVQTYLKSLADFFVEQGTMNSARESYDDVVNVKYLQTVLALQLSETTNDPALTTPQEQD